MTQEEFMEEIGYKGCQNCEHQIEPLRRCDWAESGGDGKIHIICPMWRMRGEENDNKVQCW